MAASENKRKSRNVAADSSAELVASDNKTPLSLNTKKNVVNKSSSQEFVQPKEAETSSKDQKSMKGRKRRKKEEKQDTSEKREAETCVNLNHVKNNVKKDNNKTEETNKQKQKFDKRIGGIIFMCSTKTKPDCFRYSLMGVSASKQELVLGIKPGLKLFLFDFDLKLMYGIYEASANGGMKLEPRAFSGAFPAQVRFKILKDCIPLPEGIFKKAIKENYDERTRKFKTELTVEQVKRLSELFHPVPSLHSVSEPSVQELVPVPVGQIQCPSSLSKERIFSGRHFGEHQSSKLHQGSVPFDLDNRHIASNVRHSSNPLFLSEKEYRSYGLQPGRHPLPTVASDGFPASHKFDNYRADHVEEDLPSNFTSVEKGTGHSDQFFLSEKEYRTYGLKGSLESNTRITPATGTNRPFEDSVKDGCNPYDDSTTSLVNRYLSLPRTGSIPSESYYVTERGAYTSNSSYIPDRRELLGSLNPDGRRPYSTYTSDSITEYNQNYQRLVDEPNFACTTVSSRYSFGGPSMLRR